MKLARQPMMVPESALLGPSTKWSPGLIPAASDDAVSRSSAPERLKRERGRLTLSEPESEDRSFANYFNGPIRIVIENLFGSLVANDHMPPLTEELHIRV